MTSADFLSLNISDRGDFLWANGRFVASREYYGYKVALYVIPGLFYVEVWIFKDTKKIEKIEPIADQRDLNLYLNDIRLDKLVDGYPFPG